MKQLTTERLRVIKLYLESAGHPDPIGFIARGWYFTKFRNKSKKDLFGWMSIPADVFDEFLFPPDEIDVDSITKLALARDLSLYNDYDYTVEDMHRAWFGGKNKVWSTLGFDRAIKYVNEMFEEDISTVVDDVYVDAVNDTDNLNPEPAVIISDRYQLFRLRLIEMLGV